jgi:uncharacterized protein
LSSEADEATTDATTTFHVLPHTFVLLRFPPTIHANTVPDFVFQSSFYTISRSAHECSVVCEQRWMPQDLDEYNLNLTVRIEPDWRVLRLGVMNLSLTGVAARFAGVLANAGVALNIIATYDTDYVMVKQAQFLAALKALRDAGYTIADDALVS